MKCNTPEKASIRSRLGHLWFSPGWTDENEIGALDHGEFQSPVWNCVSLAIASDRARDATLNIDRDITYIPGTSHGERGGDLRGLLDCVARSQALAAGVRRDNRRSPSHEVPRRELVHTTRAKERRVRAKSLATIGLLAAFVMGVRAKRSLGRLAA